MVGPLARVKNAFALLSPMARQVAAALELDAATVNPYRNLVARLVEVVHCVEQAIHLVDEILLPGLRREAAGHPPRRGRRRRHRGAARDPLSRLPLRRGRLHRERRLRHPHRPEPGQHRGRPARPGAAAAGPAPPELTLRLESLVRAYDPCISCSTHLLTVAFE